MGIAIPSEWMEQPEDVPRPFPVWPENWEPVVMFSRLQTQWRTGPRGLVGLDYGIAQWLFSLYSVTDPLALLEDLQIMESAVLLELRN